MGCLVKGWRLGEDGQIGTPPSAVSLFPPETAARLVAYELSLRARATGLESVGTAPQTYSMGHQVPALDSA
jgi:hypothetical protein